MDSEKSRWFVAAMAVVAAAIAAYVFPTGFEFVFFFGVFAVLCWLLFDL